MRRGSFEEKVMLGGVVLMAIPILWFFASLPAANARKRHEDTQRRVESKQYKALVHSQILEACQETLSEELGEGVFTFIRKDFKNYLGNYKDGHGWYYDGWWGPNPVPPNTYSSDEAVRVLLATSEQRHTGSPTAELMKVDHKRYEPSE